jgi:hypothetical protein
MERASFPCDFSAFILAPTRLLQNWRQQQQPSNHGDSDSNVTSSLRGVGNSFSFHFCTVARGDGGSLDSFLSATPLFNLISKYLVTIHQSICNRRD